VPVPVSSYRTSSRYLWAGLTALVLTGFSAWVAFRWPFAWIASILFLGSSFVVLYLALRPPVEIYETHLKIGSKTIPWMQVRRLDRGSQLPLVVRLTLADKTRILLVYAGDLDSASNLLRHLRRFAREALIDGVPYRQFWGEAISAAQERKQLPPPRYPLLLPEDETEVERMFQRLKSVGHIDQKTSSEDK
jgi:hypothetical protein